MIETRVSLPTHVSDRWREMLARIVDDPEGHDCDPQELQVIRTLSEAPIKVYKTRDAYTIPHYGIDDPRTWIVSKTLQDAIYDTMDLLWDITKQHEGKLQKMRENWERHGTFQLPKSNKPKVVLDPQTKAMRNVVQDVANNLITEACVVLNQADSPVTVPASFRKDLVVRYDWSQHRRSSRGGVIERNKRRVPYLTFACKRFNKGLVHKVYREYDRIAHSREIGSMAGPWQVYLATIVAHEVAHAVQHSALWSVYGRQGIALHTIRKSDLKKPHGEGWKEIYRHLRTRWVNRMDGYECRAGETW